MTKKAKKPRPGSPAPSEHELLDAAREVLAEADALLSSKKPPADRFREAVEKLRRLVPEAEPPPAKRAKPGAPRTQEEWDERVLEWAVQLETPITLDRAFAALAPGAPIGSAEHNAIAASLNRLPRKQFAVSWYMANTALAPVWTRLSK